MTQIHISTPCINHTIYIVCEVEGPCFTTFIGCWNCSYFNYTWLQVRIKVNLYKTCLYFKNCTLPLLQLSMILIISFCKRICKLLPVKIQFPERIIKAFFNIISSTISWTCGSFNQTWTALLKIDNTCTWMFEL